MKPNVIGVALLILAACLVALGLLVPLEFAAGTPSVIGLAGLVLAMGVIALVSRRWLGPLLSTLAIIAVGTLACGAIAFDGALASAGVVSLVVVGATTALTMVLQEQRERSPTGAAPAGVHQLEETLQKIHDHTMLSESAKRVLFRERELDLLRGAIESDIRRGDYSAALRLCDDLADLFGYREEAESFRARLDESRRSDYEAQAGAAMEQLESMLTERNWAAAHDIAARIRRLFPDSHHITDIDARIERARAEHKHELEEQFLDAARREDVELAMDRLRHLDRYLDRDEASRISEVAKEIVAKHRENLSVRFKLAVNGHDWIVAARIGEAITNEFPNTKMAEEVRSMIDVIRTRATQAAVASEET